MRHTIILPGRTGCLRPPAEPPSA